MRRFLAFLRSTSVEAWIVRAILLAALTALVSVFGDRAASDNTIVGIKGVAWYLAGIIELPGLILYMLFGGVHGPLSEGQGVAVVSIASGCVWAALVPFVRLPSRRKSRRVGSTTY